MSGKFDIFKNLDTLRKTNLLDQLRTLQTANNLNGVTSEHDLSNDDFEDLDILLNNNTKKSPKKRAEKVSEVGTDIKQKKPRKQQSSQRSSTGSTISTDVSLSPRIDQLVDVPNKEIIEVPIGRRTRRSLELSKQNAQKNNTGDKTNEETIHTSPTRRGRRNATKTISRGRGRGRGKGRGRGRGRTVPEDETQNDDSFISNDSSMTNSDADYDPEGSSECSLPPASTSTSIMDRFLQRGTRRSQTMRARRNYLAEVAARAPQVDFIDLVSSPMPRVEGSITLDSDGEVELPRTRSQGNRRNSPLKNKRAEKNPSLDISLEDDNPELSVKINWKGKPEIFKLRRYQKFLTIFKVLAEREGADLENIVFNIGDRIVAAEDTPDSIDYKIFQFINGRVLSASLNTGISSGGTYVKKQRNANQIALKIQSDEWKRPLQIDIQKTDKFRILYIKCAEELNVGIDQIKLSFDGDHLELNDTPASLDLEGGEAIDLRIKD